MNSECLKTENLVVGWSENKAICKIDSFTLERGRITVLCGPNGVGKSTFLRTLAAQLKPLQGEILIDGTSSMQMERSAIAKRLAFVSQFNESRKNMTVEEMVYMGRNPHQTWWSWTQNKQDKDKVEQALQRTACIELRKSFLDSLSGGERQRVAIATALAQDPSYILMDEPTAHLDFQHQLELLELLVQLKEERLGVLIALHDLNLTARIADDVLLLKKSAAGASTIAAHGPVDSVLTSQRLAEVYNVDVRILREDGYINFIPQKIVH